MTTDPAKQVIYNQLRIDASSIASNKSGLVVVDAASGRFKHRYFFPNYSYVGVDINRDLIFDGIKKYPNDFGFHADISHNVIGISFADLIVSTHTIEYVKSEEDKLNFIKNLSSALRPGGAFVLAIRSELLSDNITWLSP